jgi:mRNA interferase MazF
MSKIQRFDIWITDMNPGKGTEPGKIRPVVIVQSDILHKLDHISTIICPISSQIKGISTLRIAIEASKINRLKKDSSVLADQIKAIDLSRLIEKIGTLEQEYHAKLQTALSLILDLEIQQHP